MATKEQLQELIDAANSVVAKHDGGYLERTPHDSDAIERLRKAVAAIADPDPRSCCHGSASTPPQGPVKVREKWHYEDQLPAGYPYSTLYPYSKIVDGVRMFPPTVEHPAPIAEVPEPAKDYLDEVEELETGHTMTAAEAEAFSKPSPPSPIAAGGEWTNEEAEAAYDAAPDGPPISSEEIEQLVAVATGRVAPRYRAFASAEEAATSLGIPIRGTFSGAFRYAIVTAVDDTTAFIGDERVTFEQLFTEYETTDGSPCGVREAGK